MLATASILCRSSPRALVFLLLIIIHRFVAHPSDIFSLAATPVSVLSASGSSTLRVHSTTEPTFPEIQAIEGAHKLGIHHVCTSRGGAGKVAASVGFGGDVKVWTCEESGWKLSWEIPLELANNGDVWALALSVDERYLACTTHDGQIWVWDLEARKKIQTYETGSSSVAGSFGMTVDLSRDGKLTASGHQSGTMYIFNNDAGRLVHSLPGRYPKQTKPSTQLTFSLSRSRKASSYGGFFARLQIPGCGW